MSNRPHLMQLAPDEDVNSIRDRLSFIRGQRVLLVWPEEGKALKRKLDLVLVQREAMRRAIRLAIVTHDAEVIKNAEELNISTFETIGESERKRWKRGRSKVFTNRFQKPETEPYPQELQEVASRVKNVDEPDPIRQIISRTIAATIVLLIVLGAAYILVPGATVTLTPQQDIVETTVLITASPNASDINVENDIVPMTKLRLETIQSGTIETTGIRALDDTRAVGSVVFINRTPRQIEIPEGTAVGTSAGTPIQFRTLETITLAGGVGLQAEVAIEALQDFAGPIGNVRDGMINTVLGPLVGEVDVRNISPTTGGSSRTVKAINSTDVERLEAMVRQQIQAQAYTEMQPLMSPTQFIILETLRIAEERNDWKEFSANVGDTADTLSLNMRAVVEAAAIDNQFGEQIAFANLSSMIPRGRFIKPESLEYTRGPVSSIEPDGSVTFEMTVSAIISEPIDISALQRQLIWKTNRTAMSYIITNIDLEDGTVPEIELSPSWLRRMPVVPFRITVVLNEASPT